MRLTDDQLREFMRKNGMITSIFGLPDFPLADATYPQIVTAIREGNIEPAVLYDPDARHTILNRNEKLVIDLLGNLMAVVPIAFLVAAIWTKQWILLAGTPGFLLAALVSSPWARKQRSALLCVAIFGMCFGFWKHWSVGMIFSGLLVSIGLAVAAREYVNAVVRRETLRSEPLFCYAFQTGLLHLKELRTGRIFSGKEMFRNP